MFRTTTAMALVLACASSSLAQNFCLTTSFESYSYVAGNMFDIEPKRDVHLTRWRINTSSLEMVTVEIYWREGSYAGHENDPSAWTLLGSATTQGQGMDYPTSINVGLLPAYEGHAYGIYVYLVSYDPGGATLRHARGWPTVFENNDLKLTTGPGMRGPAFGGTPESERMWSGTVCYEDPRPVLRIEGSCPGLLTVSWADAAPDSWGGVCYADGVGTLTLPAGPCGGTVLGLNSRNLQLVRSFETGTEGRGAIYGRASESFCGGYVQLIFMGAPCEVSNVVRVPE